MAGPAEGGRERERERERELHVLSMSGVSEVMGSLFWADLEHTLTRLNPRPMIHIQSAPQSEEDGLVMSFRITKLLG